jgi:hypothetical protein
VKEPRAPNSYQTNTEKLTQKNNRQDFGEDDFKENKPTSSCMKSFWTAHRSREEANQKANSTGGCCTPPSN